MKHFAALSIFIVLAISVQAIPGNANVDAGDQVALSKSDRRALYNIVRDCSQQAWPSADGRCLQNGLPIKWRSFPLATSERT
jgi:hypothetical protein